MRRKPADVDNLAGSFIVVRITVISLTGVHRYGLVRIAETDLSYRDWTDLVSAPPSTDPERGLAVLFPFGLTFGKWVSWFVKRFRELDITNMVYRKHVEVIIFFCGYKFVICPSKWSLSMFSRYTKAYL